MSAQTRSALSTAAGGSLGQRTLIYCLPFAVTFLHVFLAPFTKVEESFSLHAVYDVLRHGILPSSLQKFDHLEFPGAVPRSFIPSIILAGLSYPVSALAVWTNVAKSSLDIQIIVRLVLASVFSSALNSLTGAVWRRFGASPAIFFILLSVTQFHIPYYASRTLPNFLAMPPIIYAIAQLIDVPTRTSAPRAFRRAITIITFTATVVRLELALLVVPLTINLIVRRKISFVEGVVAGAIGGFSGLVVSVPVDSYLWTYFVWPEAYGVYFNIYQGKSADWGVSPAYYYLTSGLPKLLLLSAPLAIVAAASRSVRRTGVVGLLLPSIFGIIGGMSCVGHKEWRFVAYVVPMINLIAALAAAQLWKLTASPLVKSIVKLAIVGGLLGNLAVTSLLAYASANNYPGGQVEAALERLITNGETPRIYFPAYPLTTGASRFTFTHAANDAKGNTWLPPPFPPPHQPIWEYSKTENPEYETPIGAWQGEYDYVVTEHWEEFDESGLWSVAEQIKAFQGFGWRQKSFDIVQGTALAIVKRRWGKVGNV